MDALVCRKKNIFCYWKAYRSHDLQIENVVYLLMDQRKKHYNCNINNGVQNYMAQENVSKKKRKASMFVYLPYIELISVLLLRYMFQEVVTKKSRHMSVH